MIVCSFFTDDRYRRAAERLKMSCEVAKVPCDIRQVPDLGSWQKNTLQKSAFMIQEFDRFPEENALVWLDADAVLVRPPLLLLETKRDVMAYRWSPLTLFRSASWHNYGTLFSGTLYFKRSLFSREILEAWDDENKRHPERLDQKNLATVLAGTDPVRLGCLPPEYCWIERRMRPYHKGASPVVVHEAGRIDVTAAEGPSPVLLRSRHGLGDAFYMRPAVRRAAAREREVFVETPWPQLFSDIPGAVPVRPESADFRGPLLNMKRTSPNLWSIRTPVDPVVKTMTYDSRDFRNGDSIPDVMLKKAGFSASLASGEMKFVPPETWIEPWMREIPRPFAVVHPPTLRQEYKNASRNPNPGYIARLVKAAPWINWVSVGYLEEREEWLDGPAPAGILRAFDRGELMIEGLVGLFAVSDLVLAGPSFAIPMALALGVPVFSVFGGSMPPATVMDAAMGERFGYAAPSPFCGCFDYDHKCGKEIREDVLVGKFLEFVREHLH